MDGLPGRGRRVQVLDDLQGKRNLGKGKGGKGNLLTKSNVLPIGRTLNNHKYMSNGKV